MMGYYSLVSDCTWSFTADKKSLSIFSPCPIVSRFLVNGSRSVANITESFNGRPSRLSRFQTTLVSLLNGRIYSTIKLYRAYKYSMCGGWAELRNVKEISWVPIIFFLSVGATSLILVEINSPLNFKAPPPHEIWLTWTRTNMTGGVDSVTQYDWRRRRLRGGGSGDEVLVPAIG